MTSEATALLNKDPANPYWRIEVRGPTNHDEQFPVLDAHGKPNKFMFEARDRGIIFDVGHGAGSFWFRQAVPAIQNGFSPDSISTDLHTGNVNGPVIDIPVIGQFGGMSALTRQVTHALRQRGATVTATLGELVSVEAGKIRFEAGLLRCKRAAFLLVSSWADFYRQQRPGILLVPELALDRKARMDSLRRSLQRAVDSEDFEHAASLRDQIRRLEEPEGPWS